MSAAGEPPLVVAATGVCCPLGTRAWMAGVGLATRMPCFTRSALEGAAGASATVARVRAIEPACTGVDRLLRLAAPALREALQTPAATAPAARTASPGWAPVQPMPVFLALPASAPAPADDALDEHAQRLALELPRALDLPAELLPMHVLAGDAAAGARVLRAAWRFMARHAQVDAVLVGGVDSLCDAPRLQALHAQRVLHLTSPEGDASDGLIASEGAAFVRLERSVRPERAWQLALYPPAPAQASEARLGSEDALDGAALIDATRRALAHSGFPADALFSHWSDGDGSAWRAAELAALRNTLAADGFRAEAMQPAKAMGDAGAATLPLLWALLHEQRQRRAAVGINGLQHALAGHAALLTVAGHGRGVAAGVAAWTRATEAAHAALPRLQH